MHAKRLLAVVAALFIAGPASAVNVSFMFKLGRVQCATTTAQADIFNVCSRRQFDGHADV